MVAMPSRERTDSIWRKEPVRIQDAPQDSPQPLGRDDGQHAPAGVALITPVLDHTLCFRAVCGEPVRWSREPGQPWHGLWAERSHWKKRYEPAHPERPPRLDG